MKKGKVEINTLFFQEKVEIFLRLSLIALTVFYEAYSSYCILLPMISEADVGGLAVEAEPCHQHPTIGCCHATYGSRGAL